MAALLSLSTFLPGGASLARAETAAPAHTVARGETLCDIAFAYGLSIQDLVEANDLANPNFILAGQQLNIPPQSAGAPALGPHITYEVQPGESLLELAGRYEVSPLDLQRANHLVNPNRLRAGEQIVIPQPARALERPATTEAGAPAEAQKSPPATEAAAPAGAQKSPSPTTAEPAPPAQAAAAPAAPPAAQTAPAAPPAAVPAAPPAQTTPAAPPAAAAPVDAAPAPTAVPAPAAQVHLVGAGENLTGIGQMYDISLEILAEVNELADPNHIEAGQEIVIPAAGSVPERSRQLTARGGSASRPAAEANTAAPAPASSAAAAAEGELYWITYYCLRGQMSSGRYVYWGAVAADASVLARGTRVQIEGLGIFTVEDRYAWDAGRRRLDVWVPDCDDAIQRGAQYRRVKILN